METKREFLKKLGLLTIGGMVGGAVTPSMASESKSVSSARKKSIGLQLYSLGRELTDDVPNGLKKVVKIGYSTAEMAGYRDGKMYGYEMSEFKKLADDAGLDLTGSHVNPPVRKYTRSNMDDIADFWRKAVDDHVECGVKTIVQPGMPQMETPDDVSLVADVFNKAGEIAKAANIRWGYHNHSHEFERVSNPNEPQGNGRRPSGRIIYDLMLEDTDPSLVFFEMDVYWTVMGQQDPLDYFEKYAGRFPILHIKDRAVLGQSGMMNFKNIFDAAYKNGLDEFYVELEAVKGNITQFEGVKECFDYLNKAKFVK